MKSKLLLLCCCLLLNVTGHTVAQTVATHLDLIGNMPENYKAFVVVNKYGYALAPDPVKYEQGKPCPALVLLHMPTPEALKLNLTDGVRNFKLVLSGEESLRGLFIPSDEASNKLIFSELKFVNANPKLYWRMQPVKGTKYCRIVSLSNPKIRASTNEDGELIRAADYSDGDQWELIRVK